MAGKLTVPNALSLRATF